ncbi:MAG: COR domain-containing protein [Anaerolineales bacterium]
MAHNKAYYQAEKKIEQARLSGATILDLHNEWNAFDNRPLTELPESLGQLTQLQSLNLSDNELKALPEWLGQLTQLQSLDLSNNRLTTLPESIGQLKQLQSLNLSHSQLTALPESIGQLTQLQSLDISYSKLTALPESIGQLTQLQSLDISYSKLAELPESLGNLTELKSLMLQNNQLTTLPETLSNLTQLQKLLLGCNHFHEMPTPLRKLTKLRMFRVNTNALKTIPTWISEIQCLELLDLEGNQLNDLPPSITQLEHLTYLELSYSSLNPELAAAYEQGIPAVMAYLRAKAEGGQIILNEAKLILVGEGGVGKTSLLAALRGDEWVEKRETTHGVEVVIKSLVVKDPETGKEITLNGWDFGGQNIYRHTHQLFFTAPAVYLAVWNPRRGPEQCCVAEWIKMIKHRAYDETRPGDHPRILVVATNGGPKERLDHIDEQALRDEFGDLIAGFYHIDSKPDANGVCYRLDELKLAIAREAAAIPSVGRSVPLSWKNVLDAVRKRSERDPYITYDQFEALCGRQKVSNELAATYAAILNELGHLIYYRGDETLKDTVILKPDYLSKAISFVLEDKAAKEARGLVEHRRLDEIWNDPARAKNERYPAELHPIFLRLMQRFDLSYQVVMPAEGAPPTSLMAQLVPGVRPEDWESAWGALRPGDAERVQVCRVLDAQTGRSAEAEGLMYRLIVRLHRYSLGRKNYYDSRHWKTGLLLDDGYNGRAFIEEIGGDLRVTARAAYPERFLSHLCSEIQWLVDHFWKGLDAKLFVPCPDEKCKGLLEIDEMLDNKSNGLDKIRCPVCRKYHEIDPLMATMQPKPIWEDAVKELRSEHKQMLQAQDIGFSSLSTQLRVLMSQADEQYEELLRWLSDPAKDGPRLFSFEPVDRARFDPRSWTRESFRLTLWCEHARLPLPCLNGAGSTKGVYTIELTREWFREAAPMLKLITGALSLALPVAAAGAKLALPEDTYKDLDFGKEIIDASYSGGENIVDWMGKGEALDLPHSAAFHAESASLRELHAFLKAQDPSFGGLVRVQNKRQEFLWVHKQFIGEY